MINIENSLICSILENDFILNDDRIIKHVLNHNIFKDEINRFIVIGINRLKELDEPICTDTLKDKLSKAGRWSISLEDRISYIISVQPFGSYYLFKKYYDYLEKQHRLRESLYA